MITDDQRRFPNQDGGWCRKMSEDGGHVRVCGGREATRFTGVIRLFTSMFTRDQTRRPETESPEPEIPGSPSILTRGRWSYRKGNLRKAECCSLRTIAVEAASSKLSRTMPRGWVRECVDASGLVSRLALTAASFCLFPSVCPANRCLDCVKA